MEDRIKEYLKGIENLPNDISDGIYYGNFKRKRLIQNCLIWVVDNFDEVEPMIKKLWLDKERAKLDKER